jgi:UbiD family decarboxylase
MEYRDLRDWIERVRDLGELRDVRGATWEEDIGRVTEMLHHTDDSPAVLFDDIPGYPAGFRILANANATRSRLALTLGLPVDIERRPLMDRFLELTEQGRALPPRVVTDGPVMENVLRGDDVDVLKFPSPQWHPLDGGRYLGTGVVDILKDPDSDWVNLGTYRVMVHDAKRVGVYISPGKHGRQFRDAYFKRKEPCPILVVCGVDPLLFIASTLEVPQGISEYDWAGGIRGEPYDVITEPITGLPMPASAEIVLAGFLHHDRKLPEGPFGEWTGYYAAPERDQPVIHVSAVLHRPDPINLGVMPGMPPNDNTYYLNYLQSALVWDQLEKAGIPNVRGVWAHESGGGRMMVTVSIKQQFPGHSKQTGLVATACRAGAYVNHLTVVVDEDIDPTDTDRVLWAMVTRVDPREDVEILRRMQASPLDPVSYPAGVQAFNARMVIDACRPWERLATFPRVAQASPELRARVRDKFPDLFG